MCGGSGWGGVGCGVAWRGVAWCEVRWGNFDITNQFHHVFWLGDLNYRVQKDIQVSNIKICWWDGVGCGRLG